MWAHSDFATERGSGLSISRAAIRHIMDVVLCYWEKILPGIIHLQKFNCYIKRAWSLPASALALIRDFSLSSLVYNAINLVSLLSCGCGNGKKPLQSLIWTLLIGLTGCESIFTCRPWIWGCVYPCMCACWLLQSVFWWRDFMVYLWLCAHSVGSILRVQVKMLLFVFI